MKRVHSTRELYWMRPPTPFNKLRSEMMKKETDANKRNFLRLSAAVGMGAILTGCHSTASSHAPTSGDKATAAKKAGDEKEE
jgi:hypothetical protein